MKILKLLIVLFLTASLCSVSQCGCGYEDNTATDIEVINNSTENIYVDGDFYLPSLYHAKSYNIGKAVKIGVGDTVRVLIEEDLDFDYPTTERIDHLWIRVLKQSTIDSHTPKEIQENRINDGLIGPTIFEAHKKKHLVYPDDFNKDEWRI